MEETIDKNKLREYLTNQLRILRQMYEGSIEMHQILFLEGAKAQIEIMWKDLLEEDAPGTQPKSMQ